MLRFWLYPNSKLPKQRIRLLVKDLTSIQEAFSQWEKEFTNKIDSFWNGLTEEERLLAFCYVSKGIYKGELEDETSYRGVLYDTFGFGAESYMPAQFCGYLAIHNAISNESSRKYFLDNLKSTLQKHLPEEKIEEVSSEIMKYHP